MDRKVSVIVPVYSTEKYLTECLDSIIHQTLKEIEIIIINDCSPDGSIDIIRKYEKADNRIVGIDKQQNEGVGKARNDGIKKAAGEFVIFMDSDDLYPNESVLAKLYDAAKENRVLVSAGRIEKLHEDGTIELEDNPIVECGLSFNQSGLTNYIDFQYDYGYQSYLFNRKMLIDNGIMFPGYSRFQDPPFFVKAMCYARQYYFLNEPVYRYRLITSQSKYTMGKTMDLLTGVIDNLRFSREHGLDKLHCLSAFRLNTEGSFMAIQNLYHDDNDDLLAKLIEANQAVDVKWLKANGYVIQDPYVLNAFKYAVETAGKYERLRKSRVFKIIKRITK